MPVYVAGHSACSVATLVRKDTQNAMATKQQVEWIDDLTGKPLEDDDAETGFRFAVDGFVYEIDTSKKSADAFRKAVARYVGAARKIGKLPLTGPYAVQPVGKRTTVTSAEGRDQSRAVREWARKNGWPDLGDRGRIPTPIMKAFNEKVGRTPKKSTESA